MTCGCDRLVALGRAQFELCEADGSEDVRSPGMERKGWDPTVRQFLRHRMGWDRMGREALDCVEECVLEVVELRIRN